MDIGHVLIGIFKHVLAVWKTVWSLRAILKVFCRIAKAFNPLTAGIGRISPGLFLNCPYKKPVI
jgi:hypothetical protein